MTRSPVGKSIAALQMLRAVAALMVVLWHSDLTVKAFDFRLFDGLDAATLAAHRPWFLNHLYFGVDIFFVLSGFIMAMLCASARTGVAGGVSFLVDRWLRILPPYWLASTLVALAYIGSKGALNLGQFEGDFEHDLMRFFGSLAMVEEMPVLGVGWTLDYEFWFYALCALMLLIGVPKRLPWALTLLASFGVAWTVQSDAVRWHYWLSPLHLEFLAGVCAFGMVRRGGTKYPRLCIGSAVLLFAAYCLIVDRWWPGNDFTLLRSFAGAGVGTLLIVGLIAVDGASAWSKTRLGRLLCRLGDASYSLYLFHWFVLSMLGKVGYLMPHARGEIVLAWQLVSVILAVLVSVAISERLEMPIHAWLRERWRATGAISPVR